MVFILPFMPIAMALFGVGMIADGLASADEEQAQEIAEDSQSRYEYACEAIEELGEATQGLAVEYGILQLAVKQNTIGRFITLREQINRTCSHKDRTFLESFEGTKPQQIREYQSIRLEANFIANSGLIAADTIIGVAAEQLVEKGSLALVGLFGTASTGTAISGLSGIAAQNATYAWFGGGSIAAGGGGMALGGLVLGGITFIPTLLFSGFRLAKGDKALTEAIEYQEKVNIEIDRIIEVENFLLKVQERICDLYNLVNELDDKAIDILNQLESKSFDRDRDAAKFQKLTFLLRAVVEIMKAPVLNNNGKLNPGTKILVVKYSNFQG
jgi:hypothetical protein